MIIKEEDIKKAEKYFRVTPGYMLEPLAIEMNTKHKAFPSSMMALEKCGINGFVVDELMLGIIIIWYVVEKMNNQEIEVITKEDIKKNVDRFHSFIEYFNDSEIDEMSELHFFSCEMELERYIVIVFLKAFGDISKVPKEVSILYTSIMKCFDDKLELRQVS